MLITQASGKIADAVASHTRGLTYFRAKGNSNPNPPTDPQTTMRTAMTDAMAAWAGLSNAQREAWATFAADIDRPGRLGPRPITGRAEFLRTRVPRLQLNTLFGTSVPTPDDPPEGNEYPPDFPLPTYTWISDSKLTLHYNAATPWNQDTDNYLSVASSPVLPPTRNFFKNPYQMLGYIQADPGTSSTDYLLPNPVTSGKHIRLRLRILASDGRLSLPWHIDAVRP